MGMECPICHTWQPFVRSITKDGLGAQRAADVLARVLGCGHTIGGEEYNAFVEQANAIDRAAAEAVMKVQRDARMKKAALWKALKPEGEVS